LLERFIKELLPVLAQKDKQFGFANLFNNLLLLLAEGDFGLPHLWLYALSPDHFSWAKHEGGLQ
jgi:hypothetical protein